MNSFCLFTINKQAKVWFSLKLSYKLAILFQGHNKSQGKMAF